MKPESLLCGAKLNSFFLFVVKVIVIHPKFNSVLLLMLHVLFCVGGGLTQEAVTCVILCLVNSNRELTKKKDIS